MTQFNISEAKANFSSLVKKAMLGEEIIIAKNNKPLVRLAPIEVDAPKQRVPGLGKHEILYMADDFDDIPEGFEDYI